MRQIVQKKKKGRPSRIDPSHSSFAPSTSTREAEQQPEPEPERRRSLRRRNVRYTNFIDYNDYLDEFEEFEEDEEEEDEDDERRKEKKFKLVLKLNNEKQKRNKVARRIHAPKIGGSYSFSDIDDDEEIEKKVIKKMKINGRHESDIDAESENDNDDYQEECRRKVCDKTQESLPAALPGYQHGFPLPDKRLLELILDKLQKKDIYGVYADPVDLEELPDYLDVIDHPMDFSTVRKKLASGSYSILEQFESDIFLICSNAMQYNTADTIYHKQAFSIQELARKKFLKLRLDAERSDKEFKCEQKPRSTLMAKKQVKKSLNRTIATEPVASEVSAGATVSAAEDVQIGFVAPLAAGTCERPSHDDGLFDANSFLVDNGNGLEKTEEPSSVKNLLSKFGRKPLVLDENRRSTYNASLPSISRKESIFSTFDCEIKQLLAVGLHAECSYARSLARFSATLGPVAWKVASQRVEKAIPAGCKYGRGWVGEYEPLPTPVLILDSPISKDSVQTHSSRAIVPDPTVALDPVKLPTVSEPSAATPRPLLDKLPNGKPICSPVSDRLARLPPCQSERWLPNGCSLEKSPADAPASNAAVAAARAWMSIGAAGFKPTLETSDKNSSSFPFHNAIAARHQPNNVPCFQIQAQWHGLNPHSHHSKPKLEPSLPPDLNISFQSPSSPIKLSSAVLLDSQQPDLALQL